MKDCEIPDLNLFMACPALRREALAPMPQGFYLRSLRRDEWALWKAMPFDEPGLARAYDEYMTDYFNRTYRAQEALFYERCQVICDASDQPVGTGFTWLQYGRYWTLHWIKVLKGYEGIGLGRGLLSALLDQLQPQDFPVFLHTQPSSYRAIKLYSDLGFSFLDMPVIDGRENGLASSIPVLKSMMPEAAYHRLSVMGYDVSSGRFSPRRPLDTVPEMLKEPR